MKLEVCLGPGVGRGLTEDDELLVRVWKYLIQKSILLANHDLVLKKDFPENRPLYWHGRKTTFFVYFNTTNTL